MNHFIGRWVISNVSTLWLTWFAFLVMKTVSNWHACSKMRYYVCLTAVDKLIKILAWLGGSSHICPETQHCWICGCWIWLVGWFQRCSVWRALIEAVELEAASRVLSYHILQNKVTYDLIITITKMVKLFLWSSSFHFLITISNSQLAKSQGQVPCHAKQWPTPPK